MEEQLLDTFVKDTTDFKTLEFPVSFEFKIGTMANDFIAKDSKGNTLAYVRQKMFKFKEAIRVFSNESKTNVLYTINADRWIDFNACYAFTNGNDEYKGSVGRKGMKSLWKANYEIFDEDKNVECSIREENPWAKVGDVLLSEIPLVGLFTGYFCNPKYIVLNPEGAIVARLSKEASFMGRRFKLDKVSDFDQKDGERMMLALMMMVLLERRRG